MVSIRKAYQRVIETPIHQLETFWKEYDAFENSLNKMLVQIHTRGVSFSF